MLIQGQTAHGNPMDEFKALERPRGRPDSRWIEKGWYSMRDDCRIIWSHGRRDEDTSKEVKL